MARPKTTQEQLEEYRRAMVAIAWECDERQDQSGERRVKMFWRLEAARCRQVAADTDLLVQSMGGEARRSA